MARQCGRIHAVCSALTPHEWSVYTAQWSTGSAVAHPCLAARHEPGGGVVVHRFSVASRDRGAESSVYAAAPSASVGRDDAAAGPPQGQATGIGMRCATAATVELLGPVHGGPPGAGAARRAARRAPVRRGGCRPARQKMVCKGHPCIYAADGDSMTQLASSKVAPCGHRRPRKLSDVHGREG